MPSINQPLTLKQNNKKPYALQITQKSANIIDSIEKKPHEICARNLIRFHTSVSVIDSFAIVAARRPMFTNLDYPHRN